MSDYYSNYTSCVHCDNLVTIKEAIIDLLKKEKANLIDSLSSSFEETNPRKTWIVGLFPGKQGWTILKTYPSELLCFKASDCNSPLISVLATKLQCDAFHLSVYNHGYANTGILLEANATGKIHISGSCNPDITIEKFYEQPINLLHLIEKFFLLEVPQSFQLATQINNHPEVKKKEREYRRLKVEKNPNRKLLNDLYDEVMKGYTERIDLAIAQIIDSSGIWAYSNILYAIYHYQNELAAAEGIFLYFQPSTDYKIPSPYTLTSEQWLETYGEIPFPTE